MQNRLGSAFSSGLNGGDVVAAAEAAQNPLPALPAPAMEEEEEL